MRNYYIVKHMLYTIINSARFCFYNTFCKSGFTKNTLIYPDGLNAILPKYIDENSPNYEQYMIDNNLLCAICLDELFSKSNKNRVKHDREKNDRDKRTNICCKYIHTKKEREKGRDRRPSIICVELPCKHTFHRSCIADWFSRYRNCPTCKMEF